MQRHFSNRGEALAEVAAAKMRAGRQPLTKSGLAKPSGPSAAAGPWQSPVEVIRPGRAPKKESKAKVKPVPGPPDL
jgi:hypothetical protein